ncbi:hypothetical protein Dsin_005780 [Dipteronia sinensis]|uniref:Zinc finger-XS domain-containing protein n=1 Tax=Dipteronia sinensis TaxID=43782 RepID=A0AAE0AXY2_9ROSI|nr:hypothetical protein Dsin_005780 [Dipteronia sinensis]
MEYSSEEETNFSDSEFIEYAEKPYEDLKACKYKVNVNGRLKCQFCCRKKKHDYKLEHLLQHASEVGKTSSKKSAKQKANHYALAKYLKNDLDKFMLFLLRPQQIKKTQSTTNEANSINNRLLKLD